MKQKIIINGIPLLSQLTGIGRYTYEVAKRLDEQVFEYRYFYGYNSKNLIHPTTQESVKQAKSFFVSISLIKKKKLSKN
ncbi:MAG: hypothetical protein C0628_02420 [Sulfurimonas sp.]|nr:MAG: hypothetical protein C0628_02420 [Sulfurimonas sp.]